MSDKCAQCGEPLPPKRRTYCSDECKRESYNESRRKPKVTHRCRNCDEEFETALEDQAYCSPKCKLEYENGGRRVNTKRECSQCGEEFVVDLKHKKYCPACAENPDPVRERITQAERKRREQEIAETLKDEAARTQVIEQLLAAQDRVSDWKPERFFTFKGRPKYPKEQANMLFGDWHMGEKITLEESGGLAEYNSAIGRERISKCLESQAEIIDIQNRGGVRVDHCNVWFLGDIVTGEKIFRGQHAYIDAYTADQIVASKNLIAETLLNMLDIYKSINCYCVVGNHGRMGEKGEGPTWNNFDWLVYQWAEDKVATYPQIKWEIPRSWFLVSEIMGWRFCAQHGDDIQMYKRIPYYGLERDTNDMAAMLWDIEEHPPNYWLYAHFHQSEQAELTHGERIMNGALPGGSLFSAKKLKRVSRPSQTFFGLSKKRGITWRYNLYLD
jgi:hypothetical protein